MKAPRMTQADFAATALLEKPDADILTLGVWSAEPDEAARVVLAPATVQVWAAFAREGRENQAAEVYTGY